MIKTMQARNVVRKEGVGFAGTEAQPRPMVHATFYKHEDGAVLVAMVKGGVVELRPTDKVRVSYEPETDGCTHLRWCHKCPTSHLRYVTAGKTGAAYCAEQVRSSAARHRDAKRGGKTAEERRVERIQAAVAAREADRAARIEDIIERAPKSREQLIKVQLTNVAHQSGVHSRRFAVVAGQYNLTPEQATAIVGDALVLAA